MKNIKKDFRKGIVKFQVNCLDDLWYLSQLIEKEDLIRGKTYRKIKLSSGNEKSDVKKIPITLTIKVEKVDFEDDSLRVNGLVESEVEDIPKGSYHSINIEDGSIIEFTKKKWFSFQIEKYESSCEDSKKILVVSLDRDNVIFAINKNEGYKVLLDLKGDVQKKEDNVSFKGGFFDDVIKKIEEYVSRFKVDNIILGSPAFWKDELYKKISNPSLKKKIILTTCYSHGENSINEVLQSQEVKNLLEKEKVVRELELVSELLENISKESKSSYGLKEVNEVSNNGAVRSLLITDTLINEYREKNKFIILEELMSLVDTMKGEIHIINGSNDAGKKLDGLGGVGAVLRYDI